MEITMKILGKDIAWNKINGELCRVLDFIPHASVRNGKVESAGISTPYASLTLECPQISENIGCPIIHRVDFIHLWGIFKERGIKEGEEVLAGRYEYNTVLGKLFSPFFPKMYILIYPIGSYNKFNDKSWWEKTKGEVLAREMKPITRRDPFPDNRFLQ
jgi:hypothetical protein